MDVLAVNVTAAAPMHVNPPRHLRHYTRYCSLHHIKVGIVQRETVQRVVVENAKIARKVVNSILMGLSWVRILCDEKVLYLNGVLQWLLRLEETENDRGKDSSPRRGIPTLNTPLFPSHTAKPQIPNLDIKSRKLFPANNSQQRIYNLIPTMPHILQHTGNPNHFLGASMPHPNQPKPPRNKSEMRGQKSWVFPP
jgi:hypothetical protein